MFAANLGLAAYQRRLAEQLGVEPGAELKAAALDARERGLPLHLIDRDVGLTFKRAMQRLGWWGRAKIGGGILASLFADEEVGELDIEKLKQGDMLEASFGEFAQDNPALYDTIMPSSTATGLAPALDSDPRARCWRVVAVIGTV